MLFEPYTRAWMLKHLDAECIVLCGPMADFFPASVRKRIGLRWMVALCGWMLVVPALLATAQPPQIGTVSGAAAPGRPAVSSGKKSASNGGKSNAAKPSTTRHRAHRTARHLHRAKPEAAPVAPSPAKPAPPPADQPANPATIDFSNGLLSIRAQNSSLVSILNQISRQTGLVIEGLSHDARMYGQYGPGNISSTLSALLDGSGYNFVIVGGGTAHSTTQLILSTGSGGRAPSPPAIVSNPETPPSADEQSGAADPTAPVQPKTPEEIFNEMRRMHPQ